MKLCVPFAVTRKETRLVALVCTILAAAPLLLGIPRPWVVACPAAPGTRPHFQQRALEALSDRRAY